MRGLLALLAGEEDAPTREEEILQARRELDAALEALRAARAAWSGPHTTQIEAVRSALDAAERQLDAARVRLQRALMRGGP
ncbi:MAG TPA: hypothetical protein VM370_13085 [Candidatus Thermoplasmatota archaeon]|nr:hypothetical protein [Candidatus Thermoplasmatota archaeon]